jgi:hypothetical protein
MFNGDRERPWSASVTAAGIDHVRLWYHYLDAGDFDASGSLLDEHAQVWRPDAPPGRGREQVLDRQTEAASLTADHRILKLIAVQDTVAVTGRCSSPRSAPGEDRRQVEFADFFTLTDEGLLLSCRRYYFVAPDCSACGDAEVPQS